MRKTAFSRAQTGLTVVDAKRAFSSVDLPDKDRVVPIAESERGPTHLLTGDFRRFGRLPWKESRGVPALAPTRYLCSRIG